MKRAKIILLVISGLMVLFFTFCNRTKSKQSNQVIKIEGSDTEYAMVQALGDSFSATNGGTLYCDVKGGGTLNGIKALINGEIDIANASRPITDKESRLLQKNKISYLPIIFATDAVAIITHPKLGVDSLSVSEVSKIFKGEITNWKEVGGPDIKINLHSRNYTSGTYYYMKEKIVHGEFKTDVYFYEGNSDIVSAVANDVGGIGYAGSGLLMDADGKPSDKVWGMPLHLEDNMPAYSPYQIDAVKNGEYPLTRPLYQYLRLPLSESVKSFIMFELLPKGQEMIRKQGFFPINDFQREINKLNGFEDTVTSMELHMDTDAQALCVGATWMPNTFILTSVFQKRIGFLSL